MTTIVDILRDIFRGYEQESIFLVGGSVRDMFLGRQGDDIDLAAALPPDIAKSHGFHEVIGKSSVPIWFRHIKGIGKIEMVLLTDRSKIANELARRDLTINAMAMNLSGTVIDPLNGRQDLEQGLLRACSTSAFLDDPLRIFRTFRFEADGWRMAAGTEALIRGQSWLRLLDTIPVERFTREMIKALGTSEPARYFQRMLEFNVGDNYLPEIFRMPFIPAGPPEHHPEGDLFTHSTQVLERVKQQNPLPLLRFCAMFHDIGKLATNPDDYPRHHGHDETGFVLARTFCSRLRLPAAYRTALAWVSRLHGKTNRWHELRDSTKLKIAEQAIKAGIAEILPLVSMADKAGGVDLSSWAGVVRIASLTTSELGIDPLQLENMPPTTRSGYIQQKRVEKLRDHH